MNGYKLSQHNFKKGKFSTPWSDFIKEKGNLVSWFEDRLPEYFWIGLIIDNAPDRTSGINLALDIIQNLYRIEPTLTAPKLSNILSLSYNQQVEFFSILKTKVPKHCKLSSISLILPYEKNILFSKVYYDDIPSIKERLTTIVALIRKTSDHQSQLSTDIRYIVLMFKLFAGKIVTRKENIEWYKEYPFLDITDEKMRIIRPDIRASEMIEISKDKNDMYLNNFWEVVSKMSDCEMFSISIPIEKEDGNIFKEEIKEKLSFYNEILIANPLDTKLLVLLSLATYAYKRVCELVEHNLYNEISGRNIVRCIIECQIMMKYLLKHENEHENIWKDYQEYGIGALKLVVKRWEESDTKNTNNHVVPDMLGLFVSEYYDENLVDMDTKYFDKANIRIKAEDVGVKEDYGLYYDYDSSFEHGLWGAIRESSLIKCNSPVHKFHCLPDIENIQKLPSVLKDVKIFMNKILDVLIKEYGEARK